MNADFHSPLLVGSPVTAPYLICHWLMNISLLAVYTLNTLPALLNQYILLLYIAISIVLFGIQKNHIATSITATLH